MARLKKRKYKQALLFFANKIPAEELGKVKLWKLLYFLDFDHYHKHEELITGESYSRLPMGPAPRHYDTVVAEMVAAGLVERDSIPVNASYEDRQIIRPKKFYDLSVFTEEERQTLSAVIQEYGSKSGKELSALSHDDPPWMLARIGEDLDPADTWYRYDAELDEGPDPIADALKAVNLAQVLEDHFRKRTE